MRSLVHSALLLTLVAGFAPAQTGGTSLVDRRPQIRPSDDRFFDRLVSPYRARAVAPVNMQNSQRLFDLIRAGQLYLSLDDAIARALEHNRDIQRERYLPTIWDTD